MAHFSIPKTPAGLVNVSVINDAGVRLSLAADDSCGALKDHGRISALLIDDATDMDMGGEVYNITPKAYLFALADLLGYTLTPKT